jgi:outer membrane protein
MKQFSLVLNILLAVAVGVLYYFHFSSAKSPVVKSAGISPASQTKEAGARGHLVAFIEIDSVYDKVEHIRQEQKKLEADQEAAAKQYENSAIKFEKDKNEYIQKAQGMTPQQREQEEAKLMQAQQSIEAGRQSQMQGLATKRSRTMEDIQSRLKQFLNDYNSDRRYAYIFATGAGLDYMMYKDSASNITADVVAGLNKSFEKKDK